MRAALRAKFEEGAVVVLSEFVIDEPKTRLAVELLDRLGVTGKALLCRRVSGDQSGARGEQSPRRAPAGLEPGDGAGPGRRGPGSS